MGHLVRPLIDWSVAGRARPGESESGDAFLVRDLKEGVLVAVVDGLGHGAEAARASRAAIAVIESHVTSPLARIAMSCHEALRETRGAVLALLRIDGHDGTLTWLGIGNVAAVRIRGDGSEARTVLVPRGGLVGHQLANPTPASLPVASGDLLIVTTDGVSWDPHDGPLLIGDTDAMAQRLLDTHAIATDDALVVVARCI